MNTEQEVLPVPRELLQLLYSYGSIHTITGVVYAGTTHKAALDRVAALLASDEQAEVVGLTSDEQRIMHQSLRSSVKVVASLAAANGGVTIDPDLLAKQSTIEPGIAAVVYADRSKLYSDFSGGVTEEMVEAAHRVFENASRRNPEVSIRDRIRAALTAALAVGDEGSWQIKLIAEPDSGEAVNTYHATSPGGKVLTVFAADEAEALSVARRHPTPPSRGEGE